jgi:hypothetical protein
MTLDDITQRIETTMSRLTQSQRNERLAAIINAIDPPARPHASDCATSNAPAYEPQWCDCGATKPVNTEGANAMTHADTARLYAAALYGVTTSAVGARLNAHDRGVIANAVIDALISRGCRLLPVDPIATATANPGGGVKQ